MVIAYHIILSAYGFWLPNDPRGSWSTFVAAWELFRYGGKATKVETTESVAHVPHDRIARLGAKRHLKYPALRWNGLQARAIARGFARAAAEAGYEIFACAILEDHVHLVIARLDRPIGQVVAHLKARATRRRNGSLCGRRGSVGGTPVASEMDDCHYLRPSSRAEPPTGPSQWERIFGRTWVSVLRVGRVVSC